MPVSSQSDIANWEQLQAVQPVSEKLKWLNWQASHSVPVTPDLQWHSPVIASQAIFCDPVELHEGQTKNKR